MASENAIVDNKNVIQRHQSELIYMLISLFQCKKDLIENSNPLNGNFYETLMRLSLYILMLCVNKEEVHSMMHKSKVTA